MKLKSAIILVVAIFLCVQCKKDKPNSDTDKPPQATGTISGNIVLPADINLDINSLTVNTSNAVTKVNSSQYNIVVDTAAMSSSIVTDNAGHALLMGYNNPASSDKTINITTTALALVMNTPVMLFLSEDGKKQVIPQVLRSAHFANLVADVKSNLAARTDLFENSNAQLYTDLGKTLQDLTPANFNPDSLKASNVKTAFSNPIEFSQSGKDLTFGNKGKTCYNTAVGIYKDNERIYHSIVAGIPLFPGSIGDVINGTGFVFQKSSSTTYTLPGDGTYSVRISTGLVGKSDGSPEYRTALTQNIFSISAMTMKSFLPKINGLEAGKSACFINVVNDIVSAIDDIKGITVRTAFLTAMTMTLDKSHDIVLCTTGSSDAFNNLFVGKIKTFIGRLNAAFFLANISDLSLFGIQWAAATPSVNLCYQVTGNDVTSCDYTDAYFVNFTVDGVKHMINKNILPNLVIFDGRSYGIGVYARLSNDQTEDDSKKGISVALTTDSVRKIGKVYDFIPNENNTDYANISYKDGTTTYSSDYIFTGRQGSVKVTDIAPTYFKGTFSGKLFNETGNKSVTITNGEFFGGLSFTTPYPQQ